MTTTRLTAWCGAGAVTAMAVHAAPALTSARRLRMVAFPRLAGVGRPEHVALTFDDGPDPGSTPRFLAALDRLGVSATFFMLGSMVRAAPTLAAEVAAAGHEVAVHGDVHRSQLRRGLRDLVDDLARARDAIVDATGVVPQISRPPYGVLSTPGLLAARRLSLPPVLWTAWGRDWRPSATAASVTRDVMRELTPGGTILLHDSDCTSAPGSWRSALGALASIVDACGARGYEVGSLAEHHVDAAGRVRPRSMVRSPAGSIDLVANVGRANGAKTE